MTTENLSPSSLGSVTYPGAVLAAFSPCPFIVRMSSAATVTMTIANGTTGRSVSERRTLRLTGTATYEATFEVSRLLQSLGDVDTLLQRIEYDSSVDTFGQLADELTVTMTSGSSTIFSRRLFMLYATADAMERRGRADTPRRLRAYRDLPFTAQMGYNDDNAAVGFVFGRSFIAACDGRDDFPLGYEVPLWGLAAAVDATKDGNTLAIEIRFPMPPEATSASDKKAILASLRRLAAIYTRIASSITPVAMISSVCLPESIPQAAPSLPFGKKSKLISPGMTGTAPAPARCRIAHCLLHWSNPSSSNPSTTEKI